jgi:hypothetical protein
MWETAQFSDLKLIFDQTLRRSHLKDDYRKDGDAVDTPDRPKKEMILYMCGVDWRHELGEAAGGTPMYGSLADLVKHRKCVSECGVVRLRVTAEELDWPVQENFSASDGTVE